jgi:RNAse (barnase) inhibitor barstar
MKTTSCFPEMKSEDIISIELDALHWKNKDDFYDSYCNATNAPKWFGRNLDALLDSLRGGICKITPEKIIIRNLSSKIKSQIGDKFWLTLEEICKEENVFYINTLFLYKYLIFI